MAIFNSGKANHGVDLQLTGTLDVNPDHAIAFWMRHDDGVTNAGGEIPYMISTAGHDESVRIRIETTEKVSYRIDDLTTTREIQTSVATYITDTAWHHYVFQWDASAGHIELFVDGSSDASSTPGTLSGSGTPTTNGLLYEGQVELDQEVNGHIVDFAFWDRILTAGEVTALSKGFSPGCLEPTGRRFYLRLIDNLEDEWGGLTGNAWSTTPDANMGFDDDNYPIHYPSAGTDIGNHGAVAQNITAPLSSVTGLLANTFTLTFTLNGILEQATLFAPAAINEGFSINAILQTATGMYIPSIPWDQTVTAPVITASGNVVAAVQWDQQLAGALLQATGTLDTGAWLIDQNLAGVILSATGILDTQTWLVDSSIAGVFIDPTGLIAATFTGEQLYTGDFTFETPDSDSFTIETPGSDSFTEE